MKQSEGKGATFAALSDELSAAVERANGFIVSIDARPGIPTSGLIWADGLVVAANHTIARDEELAVRFGDGSEASAELAGRDPGTDLALLRVGGDPGASRGEPAPVARDAELKAGQLVLSIGRNSEHGLRASLGVIGGVGGEWRTWRGGTIDRYILLDTSLFPGFSGGALVNAGGEVVGVNTSGLSRHSGVALPVATVDRIVKELAERGHVRRGYLGVALQPVTLSAPLRAEAGTGTEHGLMIIGVEEGRPAEAAGLLLGDILVTVNGIRVQEPEELLAQLGTESVGKPCAIVLLRGGRRTEVSVVVGERSGRAQ